MLRISAARGFTTIEILVALTLGLVVSLAALVLCSSGNRVVADLIRSQTSFQELLAAAELWRGEWRGVGHDPAGTAGAGINRATAETLEFSADWNGNGALLPTASNANERLAYALVPGEWKRGVNGGPRLPLAWPDSARFVYRDTVGRDLGPRPDADRIASVEIRAFLGSGGPAFAVSWIAARRVAAASGAPPP